MKQFSLMLLILGVSACSRPAPKPSSTVITATGQPPAVTTAPTAISTDEVLRCDRRSVLYDQSKHPKTPEAPRMYAMHLKPGESGYIYALTSKGGKVYVNGRDEIRSAPDQMYTTMIRRVSDGFLADCDSPELWVWLDEGAEVHADPANLTPVIGHIDVKPSRGLVISPANASGTATVVVVQ